MKELDSVTEEEIEQIVFELLFEIKSMEEAGVMTNKGPYILSKQTKEFLRKFEHSFKEPNENTLLFYLWGIGGVGKSRLLNELKDKYNKYALLTSVSFGQTLDTDTPIELMNALYQGLPKHNYKKSIFFSTFNNDKSFTSIYKMYHKTALQLKTQPIEGNQSVDTKQTELVEKLLSLGSKVILPASYLPVISGINIFEAVENTNLLAELGKLLNQHRATKKNQELQELMLDPISKLTEAFVKDLINLSKYQPIILLLDTYEKRASSIDNWILKRLLTYPNLEKQAIRIVIAGRHNLLQLEEWHKLYQDKPIIYEQRLERFNIVQTTVYLTYIGITENSDIVNILYITKGLPYGLDRIRRMKENGQYIEISKISQEIAGLLTQGLGYTQKQVLKLAACCRFFDQKLIKRLVAENNLDFQIAVDKNINCFEWLKQRDFVELAQKRYCLDDVARDTLRLSLLQDDEELFRKTHELLAIYFKEQAESKILSNSKNLTKYENADWRIYMSESIYHMLFSQNPNRHKDFLSYFFVSHYLNQFDLIKYPLQAISSEMEIINHSLLSNTTKEFLKAIEPAIVYEEWKRNYDSWLLQSVFYLSKLFEGGLNKYDSNFNLKSYGDDAQRLKEAIEFSLDQSNIDLLDGIAKLIALLYKSKFCPENQQVDWLLKAKAQANDIAIKCDPNFISDLLLWEVGYRLEILDQLNEAIDCYNRAIEVQPRNYKALYFKGKILANLDQNEEAINSFDLALKIQPNDYKVWRERGISLFCLRRYDEAISSFDSALKIDPCMLEPDLLKHVEALQSSLQIAHDSESEYETVISRDSPGLYVKKGGYVWYLRAQCLLNLNRRDEEFASYLKVLEFEPDNADALYNMACIYALEGSLNECITILQRAIELNSRDFRELAKTDSDFDNIRENKQFKALIQNDKMEQ